MLEHTERSTYLLNKSRRAIESGHAGWAQQPTSEKLAIALVLNRADWLEDLGYTIADAIELAGKEWVSVLPQVARRILEEEL